MSTNPTNPQDDADRIRLKRLAKLQGGLSSPSPTPVPAGPSSAGSSSTPTPVRTPVPAKPIPAPTPKRTPIITPAVVQSPPPAKKRAPATPAPLDLPRWEHEAIGNIFKVTLSKEEAEKSNWETVWLKPLALELESETPGSSKPVLLSEDIVDRLFIARLELDPQTMSDDLEYLPVLASLPAGQTAFEYLVGCWRRLNGVRSALLKKSYPPIQVQQATAKLDKFRDLIISYAGLTLQDPSMFPQPSGKDLGAAELVAPLVSLSSLSTPLLSGSTTFSVLSPTEVESFLQDLAHRFGQDDELEGVLGEVVLKLCHHPSLFRPEGLAGSDSTWRGVLSGLEALVGIKPIALMITRLPNWNPLDAAANNFEFLSLFGPILRLGIFSREWPQITNTYFSKPSERRGQDMESAIASLRGTLKTLQSSLSKIFNALVRASAESREAVLQYFARVITLNDRRAGMQVDPNTVSSDTFMTNLQVLLFEFSAPFMDAQFTKVDRIERLYFAQSDRIDLKEETRVNATAKEAEEWVQQNRTQGAVPQNFISDIFYLTLAMNHRGYMKTISNYEEMQKEHSELQRHVEMLEGDGSWRGSPLQARMQQALDNAKADQDKLLGIQLAYKAQLADPDLVYKSIGFVNFVSTWVIRFVDPKRMHPHPDVELPLPQDVPLEFRMQPEFILEDVIDYHIFLMRETPQSLEVSGKEEMLKWSLTFLTSTWYIKNPFLKNKMIEALSWGVLSYDGRRSLLNSLVNGHQLAMKHLVPALVHFYIEVEQTGASSQFYDKFNARRSISLIFRAIWRNPDHRDALKREARNNADKFVRFVNLMINDVTYLMDESLNDMAKIHEIQKEMENAEEFARQPPQYRREREGTLRGLERQAGIYVQLGNSTVALLKEFTAETKKPFMVPEIVDRLAAMLDYNLDQLVGPKGQGFIVKNPEKYKFNPRQLLSDILDVFLNLSDQGEFARAVAGDGRSYRKELFERAAAIARKRGLKSEDEIEKLRLFVVKVEETKATLEAEDDVGEVPDEFLDPLMYTIMRDPVTLPSSRTVIDRSTIKSHLLSDTTDPFNRVPLKLEDVVPNPELKARIDAFLMERRHKNTAFDQAPEDIVHMDSVAE